MAMKNRRTLYKLSFPNGKVYIGCTHNIKQRWAGNGAQYAQIPAVYEAIKEFGWANIQKEIIATLPDCAESDRAIKALEREFIKAYSGRCYNCISNPEWYEDNLAYSKDRYAPRVFWTVFGETKPARDWCKQYHTSSATVQNRIKKHGLTMEQALTFPPIPKEHRGRGKDATDYWRAIGIL